MTPDVTKAGTRSVAREDIGVVLSSEVKILSMKPEAQVREHQAIVNELGKRWKALVRTTFSVFSASCPINYFDYSVFWGIVMCWHNQQRTGTSAS